MMSSTFRSPILEPSEPENAIVTDGAGRAKSRDQGLEGGRLLPGNLAVFALHELAAGGGDVGAERVADRGHEAGRAEDRGEGVALGAVGRAEVRGGVDRVVRNQIHVGVEAGEPGGQLAGIVGRVVDAGEHQVLDHHGVLLDLD